MTDTEFSQLQADEQAAYAAFHAQDEIIKALASKWVQLKQKVDRENMRREIQAPDESALTP